MKLDDRFERLRQTQSRIGRFIGATYYGDSAVDEIFRAAQHELTTARSLKDARSHRNTGGGRGERSGMSFIGSAKEKGGRGNAAGSVKGPKCRTCGSVGHKADDYTSKEDSEVVCFGCDGTGYYKNKCASEPKQDPCTEKTDN